MRILLVYPQYPDTFWSFKYALKFIRKKAPFPPLGLLTVASLLPKDWDLKLIDMNIEALEDRDILWADYVFLSAMSIQTSSVKSVIERCHGLNRPIVAGGPLFTSSYESFPEVDYFVLNEAEITLPQFLSDLAKDDLKNIYTSEEWADITRTPLPLWKLVKMDKYSSMNLQYSRGCPFDCEFCDITVLYGRRPRTKTKEQVISELDNLYNMGWRGPVFFVDDNFIGNKQKLKKEILPAVYLWLEEHGHPFWFSTEASINLADDDELLRLMVLTGFEAVFIGIETMNEESLLEAKKIQNHNRDLISSIKKIQSSGLEVQGGFIVGFDHDPPAIFDSLTNFIQESGVVTAMVGLLNAPKGTKLYNRLLKEGRLLGAFSGTNAFSINFIPRMNIDSLMAGYKKILDTIYSPKQYYTRVLNFLKEFNPGQKHIFHFRLTYFQALGKSIILLGVLGKERFYYWKLFFWSLFTRPKLFSLAILLSIYGFHFRKVSTE
ncbi:MAG TPA: B12-binding domain-containing radical SAM protein [Ignavibacteriales bacterium]|nr:B12-binding domain-containing radical SAM protein [Ignavibacteriales bacterium]